MNFSFSTLINMTVTGSILIGIIYFLLKNNKILARFGTTIILGCSLLIMARFLLPFEFSFTNSVYVYDIWPDIYLFFIKDFFTIGFLSFSIYKIFVILWISGSIFLSFRSVNNYRSIKQKISSFQKTDNAVILSLVNEINLSYKRPKNFCIVETSEYTTPMIFGFKNPYIILPKITLTTTEWRYILKHEITHYYHRHLNYKLICEILCILYWWNPFVYLFKRMLSNLLEMDVDAKVTRSLPENEKFEYLDCLLKIAKQSVKPKNKNHWSVTFSDRDSTLISKRVHLMFEDMTESKQRVLLPIIGIILLYTTFMFTSFFFIIEPSSISPENSANTYSFKDNGCFFINNENGTYDFYINSEYKETFAQPFDDPNIKIYNSLKEVFTNENN